jgi:hypothetical protein
MSSVPPIDTCRSLASSARLRAEGVLHRRVALLLDTQLRMRLLHGGDRGERRHGHLLQVLGVVRLVGAGQRELDEHGAPVLGGERLLDVLDARDRVEPVGHVLDGGGHLRAVGPDRALALHQDALADLLREAGGVDHGVVTLGLAVAHLSRLQALLADVAADHGREDHEQQPADYGCRAVLRTPPACARRDVAGFHLGTPPGSCGGR